MTFVNGIEYSWVSIRMLIAGVPVSGVAEIEYSDEQEKVNNWGIGAKPVSRSYGRYEAKGSLSLHMSEVEALTNAAPGGDIKHIPPFDIIVSFVEVLGRAPIVHKLRGCEFMSNARTMKAGDTKFDVKLDLVVGEIEWK